MWKVPRILGVSPASRISFVSIKVLTTGSCLSRPVPSGISASRRMTTARDREEQGEGARQTAGKLCVSRRDRRQISETRKLPEERGNEGNRGDANRCRRDFHRGGFSLTGRGDWWYCFVALAREHSSRDRNFHVRRGWIEYQGCRHVFCLSFFPSFLPDEIFLINCNCLIMCW